ncbi:MAG: Flp family type IVb pilin [Woeseia sp.]
MRKTGKFLARFWGDESGAAAAEYVIILAIVGTALATAIILLSGAIATGINQTAECINTDGGTCL